jgi:hypothetical protein
MGQLAAAFFAVPTAAIVWLGTNKYLTFWSSDGAFWGTEGFWTIMGIFALVSVFLRGLFPSFLGKVWRVLIQVERWF